MKIIDAMWFTQMASTGTIGLVVVEDEITGERKSYIGSASGLDATTDAEHIAQTGAKFYPSIINDFLETNLTKETT